MSDYMGPVISTTAGADLSSTGENLFVYFDSSDGYKVKLLTDPHTTKPWGVLQNSPADDARAKVRRDGLASVIAGGAINPGDYITVNSASKAIKAIPGDVVFGRYLGLTTNANVLTACAATNVIPVYLFSNNFVLKGESNAHGSVLGFYKFGTDGGAVSTINLRDINGNDVTIPTGATVLGTSYRRVTTSLTSGGAATLAFSIGGLSLLGATAYDNAALTSAINVEFAIGLDKTTAATALQVAIAGAALTAGELFVRIDYETITEGQ